MESDDVIEKDEIRARIRCAFPHCSLIGDSFRSVFGDGVKVNFMSEGGESVGTSKEGYGNAVGLDEIVIESDESESVEYKNGKWVPKREK